MNPENTLLGLLTGGRYIQSSSNNKREKKRNEES